MSLRPTALLRGAGWQKKWSTILGIGWAVALCSFFAAAPGTGSSVPAGTTIFGSDVPHQITSSDTHAVQLGVQFSSSQSGEITALRFYKGPQNTGTHTGTLWSSSGQRLAEVTYTSEKSSGWQTAQLDSPVDIAKGKTYTASYYAPHGHYSADENYFAHPVHSGSLTVPAGGGVYSYGSGFPTHRYKNSNYYVDVVFKADSSPAIVASPPASTGTASPPASTPASPPPSTGTGTQTALNLPLIPWEGGSAYWSQFSKASAAGWTNPDFFPIVAWYDGISSDTEVNYDKSLGINTYTGGMWDGTPYSLFQNNNVYWIGGQLNSGFNSNSTNWVGDFLDDEVDGRYTPAAGEAHMQQLVNENKGDGRFGYANYSQSVITNDFNKSDAQKLINDYTGVVSVDMYWYTIPFCSQTPYRGSVFLDPVNQSNCRTSSSYGKTISSLRQLDASDGKLQPIWQFVENLNGGPGPSAPAVYITPDQLKGAVMNSIIHEARGIVYFNQSLSGSCQSSNVFRQSEDVSGFCGASQAAAAGQVDSQISSLASVLNTQSYQYSFGSGLDTMLKTSGGYAYIFSMVDGASSPGSRTFHLPAGVKGTSVQVLNENRTLPVSSSGTFTDSFQNESTYHIYKVALG